MIDIDNSKWVFGPSFSETRSLDEIPSKVITIPDPQKVQSKVSVDKDFSFAFYFASPVPNAFHRFMQRWLLGIYWEKVK